MFGWRYVSLLVSTARQTICLIYTIPLSLQDKTEPYFFKATPIKEGVVKHMSQPGYLKPEHPADLTDHSHQIASQ